MLLAVSAPAIFIARSGIVPTKIAALGVGLGESDQRAFSVVMALVACFLVAFAVYGFTDFLSWRIA